MRRWLYCLFLLFEDCFVQAVNRIAEVESELEALPICADTYDLQNTQSKEYVKGHWVAYSSCKASDRALCPASGPSITTPLDYGDEYTALNFYMAERTAFPGGLGERFESKFHKSFPEDLKVHMLQLLLCQAKPFLYNLDQISPITPKVLKAIIDVLKNDFRDVHRTKDMFDESDALQERLRELEPLPLMVPHTAHSFPMATRKRVMYPQRVGTDHEEYHTVGSLCGSDKESERAHTFPIHFAFSINGINDLDVALKGYLNKTKGLTKWVSEGLTKGLTKWVTKGWSPADGEITGFPLGNHHGWQSVPIFKYAYRSTG